MNTPTCRVSLRLDHTRLLARLHFELDDGSELIVDDAFVRTNRIGSLAVMMPSKRLEDRSRVPVVHLPESWYAAAMYAVRAAMAAQAS